MKPKFLAAAIAAVLVVGGGAFALTRLSAPAEDSAIEFVPGDAMGYFNVFIRPSNDQKQALDDLLGKFPGIDGAEDAIEKITNALDDALAEGGMDYQEDVEPWLGDQVAAFLGTGGTPALPNFAFLIESKNDGAAQEFVQKVAEDEGVVLEEKTYEGVSYQMEEDGDDDFAVGIVDGYLVGGTEGALKDVVDVRAGGEALDGSKKFVDATEPLADDWIGLFYFDGAAFFEELGVMEELPPADTAAFEALGLGDQKPQAGILYATGSSVAFESTGGFTPAGLTGDLAELAAGEGIVPDLPAGTWAAFGLPSFGDFFDGLFELLQGIPGFDREQVDAMFYGETGLRLQDDVLSWMEDAGLFVQGTSIQSVGGGLVIESSDPAKTTRLLERLRDFVRQQGVPVRPESQGGLEGFSVQLPGVPAPIYALGGDRLVIGYGDAALDAASADETLRDSEAFAAAQDAVGDDFNISFYVDVDGAVELGEAVAAFNGVPTGTWEEEVKPYFDVLTHVVVGAKQDGETIVTKFVVGVE